MLHQRYKDVAFMALATFTLPNFWWRRWRYGLAPEKAHELHLHLGCGPKYLPGFVNVDANPLRKIDLWLDVRCGLPFPANSVSSVYSTHMVEHLYPDELESLLRECVRVLKPGAGLRIVVPSLRNAVLAYQRDRTDWFPSDFPHHFDSTGGRLSNFLFCDGQHRTAFDFEYLCEILSKAGFRHVEESAEGQSRLYREKVPAFEANDSDLPHSLYVESFK